MIVIIDYGMGNLNSIANMVKKVGGRALVSSRVEDIAGASRLILPGVGAFDNGVKSLRAFGLLSILNKKVLEDRIPVLGICLGMQLMTRASEEGVLPGLGWFHADTRRFDLGANAEGLKVPNMGWHLVKPSHDSQLFAGFDSLPRFYFVHSYHCVCDQPGNVLATSHYGYEFCCGVHRDNIWGVQFHPEKSHRFGYQLLSNFLNVNVCDQAAAA